MRHRKSGRTLGRNASHRKAMFRNMAVSLIQTADLQDGAYVGKPKVANRIITTVPKAKELRPIVEKLITLAKRSLEHEAKAAQFATQSEKNSDAWKAWREGDGWQRWNAAYAPALALRRRAFAALRDNSAVDILFRVLADRYRDRPGGYTRIARLATPRLGDAGARAIVEFVGEHDRKKTRRSAPAVTRSGDASRPAEVPAASSPS